MGQQLLLIGPAEEVKTDHLVGALGRLLARPQGDQQTGDDGAVCLDFDAYWIGTQQAAAAENVFAKAEEDRDEPTLLLDKGNHLGRHVEQIGRQA